MPRNAENVEILVKVEINRAEDEKETLVAIFLKEEVHELRV